MQVVQFLLMHTSKVDGTFSLYHFQIGSDVNVQFTAGTFIKLRANIIIRHAQNTQITDMYKPKTARLH